MRARQRQLQNSRKLFLKQLALGRSPGVAARNVRIARATAYGWKKEDQEFDVAWVDAVETGLDALETQLYDSGMNGNSSDAQFTSVVSVARRLGRQRHQGRTINGVEAFAAAGPAPSFGGCGYLPHHGVAWRRANAGQVSLDQLKAMSAIERCRTVALGGHVARAHMVCKT